MISFLAVTTVMNLLTPFAIKQITPMMESIRNEVNQITAEENALTVNGPLVLDENNRSSALEAVFAKHPDYEFEYTYHEGLTEEKFEGKLGIQSRQENLFETVYLETTEGGIVITMSNPDVIRLSLIVILSIIFFSITILLTLISSYVSRKSKYIKQISNYLEVIEAGDLSTYIPVKGHDEMSQLAHHINQMTSALNEQQNQQRAGEELKKQLITNISHDLRTPLTAALGYLSLLDQPGMELTKENQSEYIHKAHERTQHVAHLVDQLFNYVLIANHQIQLKTERVNPEVVIRQLIHESDGIVSDMNLELIIELQSSTSLSNMDIQMCQRLFDNLFSNIQKYGVPKSVVHISGESKGHYYEVKIINATEQSFEDSKENFLERYFTTDRISGKSAGLGLAICNEIMEIHQGRFSAFYNDQQFSVIMQFKEVE